MRVLIFIFNISTTKQLLHYCLSVLDAGNRLYKEEEHRRKHLEKNHEAPALL